MQKNFSIIIVMLIIGLGVGYTIGDKSSEQPVATNTSEMHSMPDGSMMDTNTETMNMTDMMSAMNDILKGKTGDDFDKAFISEMIIHHQGAVEMAETALTNAKHQEIKNLARAIISAQKKEIADMKAWENSWYGQ